MKYNMIAPRNLFILFLFTFLLPWLPLTSAEEVEVVVSPRATVVQRGGITGGGYPVVAGDRLLNFYPNHPELPYDLSSS